LKWVDFAQQANRTTVRLSGRLVLAHLTGIQLVVSDLATIRAIVARHGRLMINVGSLEDGSDLYAAGLTSLATVNVMLALEDHFDIEFPDSLLTRKTFSSLEAIAEAVAEVMR
jgi:acyl carrier protein